MPEDVCDAIACHTTGKYGMTTLDKILYLADYIEETRDFPGVDKARELAGSVWTARCSTATIRR